MAEKGTISPKQQLEVVQVHEEKAYGSAGKTLLPIMAKNLSLAEGDPLQDKPLRYAIFNPALTAHVKGLPAGARFLADIEERPRPDTEYGPDRNIIQVYDDQGQPISKPGSRGSFGKTPELVRLEHELDLGLEAVRQVGNILMSETPVPGEDSGIDKESWTRVLGKYWQAVEKGLDSYLAPAPERHQQPPADPQAVSKAAPVPKDTPPGTSPIKHAGDLFTRAGKLEPPVSRDGLIAALSVNSPEDIIDLEEAWKLAQQMSASNRQHSQNEGSS